MSILVTILWIATGLIISEVIFILWTKYIKTHNSDSYDYYFNPLIIVGENFIGRKFFSMLLALLIITIQACIVFGASETFFFGTPHYENLIYEALIIGAIVLFFYINKKINDKILNKKEKKK
jgi:magnesium-transporting ATPase (P-type)